MIPHSLSSAAHPEMSEKGEWRRPEKYPRQEGKRREGEGNQPFPSRPASGVEGDM